jgi:hypothetical protein
MRRFLRHAVLSGVVMCGLLACDGRGRPGGPDELGRPCDEPGEYEECGPDTVCSEELGDVLCLLECGEHEDCLPEERCEGVSGTDRKSCQLDEDDFDDDRNPRFD